MTSSELARVERDQLKILSTRERNEAALRNARAKEERYAETLRRSGVELRSARRDLRRAGYLK
jgi:hypothetical protein